MNLAFLYETVFCSSVWKGEICICCVRRRVWPQYVQKSLYVFLKYNFDYWPLDSMFRMVRCTVLM